VTNSIEPLLLSLWGDLSNIRVLWQAAAIALGLIAAAWISRRSQPRLHGDDNSRFKFGLGGLRRLIFPLTALLLVLLARLSLSHFDVSTNLLSGAIVLLTAMAVIRLVVYMQRLIFPSGRVLVQFERVITWAVWLAVAFYFSGLAPDVINFFDGIGFELGKQRISLLTIGEGILWVLFSLMIALWAGRLIEERLMTAHGLNMALRVMLAKLTRAVLVLLAVLIVLPAVGIDLTALSLLGGAIGVGVGFGLQKIASNYISGFIILFDRSVTIGDVVTIEKQTGKLTKMTARYVVVRALDGTEAIVPNETLITSVVINQSYTDRKLGVGVPLKISYRSDLDLAMRIMADVAKRHVRALAEPAPKVAIRAFGENGIELELSVWMQNPEEGTGNLRSDIYHEIWQEFRQNGIEFATVRRELSILKENAGDAVNV